MADGARGRGSRDGIDCTILAPRLGSTGTVLETELPKARRCRPNVGNAPSGASTIESWAEGTQEGFSRRRTFGKAAGGRRADPQFCARCRTAAMADGHGHTPKVPADPQQSPVAKPTGGSTGRGPH